MGRARERQVARARGGGRAGPGRRRPRARAAALGAGLLWLAAPAPAAESCAPWPGEPAPLPGRSDSDPVRAEWASLRVTELTAAARDLEGRDALRAHQLWRRILCMDPANDEALAGVLRSPVVVVHRPPLRDAPPDPTPPADPWRGLSAPIGVRVDHGAEREDEERAARLLALRRAVDATRAQVRKARFDDALAGAETLRSRIAEAPPGAARSGLAADLEVAAATAQLALGRESQAVASLRRALDAKPDLALDPRTTSPKVLRALERARAEAGP